MNNCLGLISTREIEILHEISQVDKECAFEKEDKHLNHVLVTDQLTYLDRIIKQFMDHTKLDLIIVFSTLMDHHEASILVELTCKEMGKLAPRVVVLTKPCGPERLLFALRVAEQGTEKQIDTGPTVRLVSEVPPYEMFPSMTRILERRPEARAHKDVSDLSRHVNVLLVEGKYHIFIKIVDNLINQTVMSNFLHQMGVSFDLAGNGAEAVEKFKEKKYHIVFMGNI